jgi:hypothetical protein
LQVEQGPNVAIPSRGARQCYDGMTRLVLDPFQLLLISLSGWLNQQQQDVMDCLQEENRVLREQLGDRRLPPERSAPAFGGQGEETGPRVLHELATLVTLLAWRRPLIGPEIRWQQAVWPG